MLKVERSGDNGLPAFALSGRIAEQNLAELQKILDNESHWEKVTFDLEEVELVDRVAVRFLATCEARGIKLKNCPSYIRRWIRGSGTGNEPRS